MDYHVRIVEDHQLPASTDWVIVRTGVVACLVLKRSRSTPEGGLAELLAGAWAASAAHRVAVQPPLSIAI